MIVTYDKETEATGRQGGCAGLGSAPCHAGAAGALVGAVPWPASDSPPPRRERPPPAGRLLASPPGDVSR